MAIGAALRLAMKKAIQQSTQKAAARKTVNQSRSLGRSYENMRTGEGLKRSVNQMKKGVRQNVKETVKRNERRRLYQAVDRRLEKVSETVADRLGVSLEEANRLIIDSGARSGTARGYGSKGKGIGTKRFNDLSLEDQANRILDVAATFTKGYVEAVERLGTMEEIEAYVNNRVDKYLAKDNRKTRGADYESKIGNELRESLAKTNNSYMQALIENALARDSTSDQEQLVSTSDAKLFMASTKHLWVGATNEDRIQLLIQRSGGQSLYELFQAVMENNKELRNEWRMDARVAARQDGKLKFSEVYANKKNLQEKYPELFAQIKDYQRKWLYEFQEKEYGREIRARFEMARYAGDAHARQPDKLNSVNKFRKTSQQWRDSQGNFTVPSE